MVGERTKNTRVSARGGVVHYVGHGVGTKHYRLRGLGGTKVHVENELLDQGDSEPRDSELRILDPDLRVVQAELPTI